MSGNLQDIRNILSGILWLANLIIMMFLFPVLILFSLIEGLMGIFFGIIIILIQIFPIYSVFRCVSEKKPVFLKGKSVSNTAFGEMLISEPIELKPVYVIAFVGVSNLCFLILFAYAFGTFRNFPTAMPWVLNIVFSIISGIIYKPYKA